MELLVVDAPARTSRATLDLAQRSHLIVQPTGASADDLRPAVLLFHELVNSGIPRERLVAAICRVLNDTEEAAARAYMEAAGYEVLDGSIIEHTAYRQAQNRGRAITETAVAKLNERADALKAARVIAGSLFTLTSSSCSSFSASLKVACLASRDPIVPIRSCT